MDPGFKIAVARQHGSGDQIVFYHGILNGRMERAGITNAGRASVTDGLKAELVKKGGQAGLVQIFGDYPAAWRQRGFNEVIDTEAAFDGFLGQQSGGKHHRRITGIRATGDGRNQH